MLPVASKSDTHRLNLEYVDIIIDYVLSVLQQPRVSDDGVDPTSLQIKKEQVKTVNFNSTPDVIPDSEIPVEEEGDEDGVGEEGGAEGGVEGGEGMVNGGQETVASPEESDTTKVSSSSDNESKEHGSSTQSSDDQQPPTRDTLEVSSSLGLATDSNSVANVDFEPAVENCDLESSVTRAGMHSPTLIRRIDRLQQQSDGNPSENAEFEDDRLRRFAQESASMEPPPDAYSSGSVSTKSTSTSIAGRSQNSSSASLNGQSSEERNQPQQLVSSTAALRRSNSKSASAVSPTQPVPASRPSQRELSRLLLEKIPREILKRMVIRWPVGEETPRDRSEFNRKRLMITVWDVSGDVIQQNFTPFFFSDRCLYVAAYNLTRRLDSPCDTLSAMGLKHTDGSVPTNAEVLEDWVGCVTAFSKDIPAQQRQCTKHTPVLPPVVFACTHTDSESVREAPSFFHQFFDRKSFDSYRRHLVEGNDPTALGISNMYENDCQEGYSGHHLLRREIDYLARQMPYIWDNVPVQWVNFEQLIYGLQEQRKIVLLYADLEKYVTDHCRITGPLQILPVLSHYHDVGVMMYFYRHPELCNIIITKPQWLSDALSTVITSTPGRWVTGEVQNAFSKLHEEGSIGKDMLQLAYRCARMPQRYWNEMVFILLYMNLISCHPSLHAQKAVYLPAMVTQVATEPFLVTTESDPAVLHFSAQDAALPVALYNQLVVSCIRNCTYQPVLRYHQAHFQLTETHHLILTKHRTSMSFAIQQGCEHFCAHCKDKQRYDGIHECSVLTHLLGDNLEYMPSDNIATLVEVTGRSDSTSRLRLHLPENEITLHSLCPAILQFLTKNIEFLCHCWFPGLHLGLVTYLGDRVVVLDQYWKHTALCTGTAPSLVCMWFNN